MALSSFSVRFLQGIAIKVSKTRHYALPCGLSNVLPQSLLAIKKQFDGLKRFRAAFLVTRLLHPNKAGAALWCRGAALYLQRQLQALRRVALPADGKDAEQALDLFETVISMLQVSRKTAFS